jgi:hypothetical protein
MRINITLSTTTMISKFSLPDPHLTVIIPALQRHYITTHNLSKLSHVLHNKQHSHLNISLPSECKYRKHSSYKPESNQAHRQEGNASVISAVGTVGWFGYHIACGQCAAESTPILIYTTKLTFKTFALHDKPFKGWSRKCIRIKKCKCWAEMTA